MSKLSDLSKRIRSSSIGDARVRAHEVFDQLWLSGGMTRPQAYEWLCEVMGKTEEEGHIGRFDIEECEALIKSVNERINDQHRDL